MMDTLEHWRAALPTLTALLLLLTFANALLMLHTQRRDRQMRHTATQTLLYLLGLIQQLQKHRALGGRGDSEASQQRAQLAPALERLWSEWPQHFPEAVELSFDWQQLQHNPTDFDAHCRLIDRLLAAMELVEQRAAAGATPFGARCRVIEDLGQLRGLAVRAAGLPRCPVQMEVPLRYLCLRLTSDGSQKGTEPALHNALRDIEQRLLQRQQGPALTPADCFALLTPLIDRALDGLRAELQAATTPVQRKQTASAATGVPIWSALP